MSSGVPRTVKAVDTPELVRLDAEAIACGLNRNHGPGWLVEYADPAAVHYLWPVLMHRLVHRPEFSPHWRCMLLLATRDGQQVVSLLDVLPTSFEELPETLDAATKSEIAHQLEHGGLLTQAQWADLKPLTRISGGLIPPGDTGQVIYAAAGDSTPGKQR